MSVGPAMGRYFYVLDEDGRIHYQGRILRRLRGGWFIVQFFNWIDGSPTNVEREAMMEAGNWVFYDFGFQMHGAYEAQQS